VIASATVAGCSERHHFLFTRRQMRTVSWSLPLCSCCLLCTFAFWFTSTARRLDLWSTINPWRFLSMSECQDPCTNVKPPCWKHSGDDSGRVNVSLQHIRKTGLLGTGRKLRKTFLTNFCLTPQSLLLHATVDATSFKRWCEVETS